MLAGAERSRSPVKCSTGTTFAAEDPHDVPFPPHSEVSPLQVENRGFVRLDGRDICLGKYDSPEIWTKCHPLMAEWPGGVPITAPAARPNKTAPGCTTVNHVLLAYWRFAETYYLGDDGAPTKELSGMRDALRPVLGIYGHSPAADFGPKALKVVRDHMIDVQELCRTRSTGGSDESSEPSDGPSARNDPPPVSQGLSTVKGLGKGQSRAGES